MILLLAIPARADLATDLLTDPRAAVTRNPEDQKAWLTLGTAGCTRKDLAAAVEALGHLKSDADAQQVQRVCETNGLHVDRSHDRETAREPEWTNVDAEIDQAREAYVGGRYSDAIARTARVLAHDPHSARAWRILSGSACFFQEGEIALRAKRHLSSRMDHDFVDYVCKRNGIRLATLAVRDSRTTSTAWEIADLRRRFPMSEVVWLPPPPREPRHYP
jgi:hypothetical protein